MVQSVGPILVSVLLAISRQTNASIDDLTKTIYDQAAGTVSDITDGASSAYHNAADGVSKITDTAGNIITGAADGVGAVKQTLDDIGVTGAASDAANAVKDSIQKDGVVGTASKAGQVVSGLATDAYESGKATVDTAISIKQTMDDTGATDALKGMAKAGVQAGAATAAGYVNSHITTSAAVTAAAGSGRRPAAQQQQQHQEVPPAHLQGPKARAAASTAAPVTAKNSTKLSEWFQKQKQKPRASHSFLLPALSITMAALAVLAVILYVLLTLRNEGAIGGFSRPRSSSPAAHHFGPLNFSPVQPVALPLQSNPSLPTQQVQLETV